MIKEECKTISDFFSKLSERRCKEDYFSDVVWALCNSNEEFKNTFISFIFDDQKFDDLAEAEITREYPSEDGSCKIDFQFEYKEKNYLIENKIYGIDDHFEKYDKQYKDSVIGFISNYPVDKKPFYKYKKTWNEFYRHLIQQKIDDFLIEGFLSYLKGVCSIMDFEKMEEGDYRFNIRNVSSLNHFHDMIDNIIRKCESATCEFNNRTKSIAQYCSGKDIKFNIDKMTVYLWFGIFTAEYSDNICIGLTKKDNPKIFDIVSNSHEEKSEKTFSELKEDGIHWFEMEEESYEKLKKDEIEIENKYETINVYFNEVVGCILKRINQTEI